LGFEANEQAITKTYLHFDQTCSMSVDILVFLRQRQQQQKKKRTAITAAGRLWWHAVLLPHG
jgi:hypothetical protein